MNRSFLKFIGPGLLITVGFIDPGNWAANVGLCPMPRSRNSVP